MELLRYEDIDLSQTVKRSEEDVNNVLDIVSDILKNVRQNKDQALKDYTQKFDKVIIDNLKVTDEEIKEAYDTLDDNLLEALKKAAANIEKFHKKEIPEEWNIEVREGITAGQIVRPINSVGCYIPGGRAAYPSTILMTVIPAKIAGVKKIICCSPPQKDGKIGDAILVAAHLAGADEIYKVGGAQAIGAMAYSTESIPKVEKIVGPGNIFVTAAKKLVYGEVDIEFPAGPSEVLILADKTANAEYIATDILSQAEHDPKASCFFVTDDENLAEDVLEFVRSYGEKRFTETEINESYKSKRSEFMQKKERRELPTYEKGILDVFIKEYPADWEEEGISHKAMDRFNIRFSIGQNKIIIPHYNVKGGLIGIRG